MEQHKALASPKKVKGNPPLRRGQIRNRIIMDFFRSLAAFGRVGRANGAAGSGTNTPTSSSAYNSEGTSDS